MSSESPRSVIYYFKNHKKINGTLFYCFEYFICSSSQSENVFFYLYNISDEELVKIKKIFSNRYNFKNDLLEKVININSISELYRLNLAKSLILDIHTFEKIAPFLRADIVCYSDVSHEMTRSPNKKITYYGFYDYQNFDFKVSLKINFGIFKPLTKTENTKVFISASNLDNIPQALPMHLNHLERLVKAHNLHIENLFELFDSFYYFHNGLDTNNRLIPECFFYKKIVHVDFNGVFNDSVYLRYVDIQTNGLSGYRLTSDDPMIQDFLN